MVIILINAISLKQAMDFFRKKKSIKMFTKISVCLSILNSPVFTF